MGQGKYEEIDRVKTGKGINFGWRKLEGRHYYKWTWPHVREPVHRQLLQVADRRVHPRRLRRRQQVRSDWRLRRRAARVQRCNGKYVFGDDCSGKVWVIPANLRGWHGAARPGRRHELQHQLVRRGQRRTDLPRRPRTARSTDSTGADGGQSHAGYRPIGSASRGIGAGSALSCGSPRRSHGRRTGSAMARSSSRSCWSCLSGSS